MFLTNKVGEENNRFVFTVANNGGIQQELRVVTCKWGWQGEE